MTSITVLDGGMGQELLRHADRAPTPLWSAQVMIDQPDLVRRVHHQFVTAGADVLTVNAYSATRCRLGPAGLDHEYEGLQRLACELATEARDERPDVMIAGCLSPYGWSYRPELAPPFEELWQAYAETALLQAPFVDLMLCETMGSIDEARAAARGAAETGLPIWIGWSLRDDGSNSLRSGEPLTEALASVEDWSTSVDAVLVNCSTPETVTESMPTLATGHRRFGGYANGFSDIVDEFRPGAVTTLLHGRHDVGPTEYATTALGWIDRGATIVGGCCEIGPAHIAEIARRLGRTPVS